MGELTTFFNRPGGVRPEPARVSLRQLRGEGRIDRDHQDDQIGRVDQPAESQDIGADGYMIMSPVYETVSDN